MGTYSSTPPSPASSATTVTPSGKRKYEDMEEPLSIDDAIQSQALDFLGRESRLLLHSIKDLRSLGVEDIDLPLPKLCVVGGQSHGKSSLIEGISAIRVPRSEGTTTRCPLEINLSESEPYDNKWICKVSVVIKYEYVSDANDAPIGSTMFGSWYWINEPPKVVPFCTLTQKADVTEAIRRAQLATINPRKDPLCFRPGNVLDKDDEDYQTDFSPNIVRLEIQGPQLPNLCFFDLPGFIHQAPDYRNVDLVSKLVTSYIESERCIILCTQSMGEDVAFSYAGGFITRLNAKDRTVGILTKPDKVSEGGFNQFCELLDGKKFKVDKGYYVVMNSANPAVEHHVAREREVEFFETTPPYCTDWTRHRARFGTRNLQNALSNILVEEIKKSLPTITEQIKQKVDHSKEMLEALPKQLEGNISLQVNFSLDRFADSLGRDIEGGTFEHKFFTEWLSRAEQYHKMMAGSWPKLSFTTSPSAQRIRRTEVAKFSPTPIRETIEGAIEISDGEDTGKTDKKQPASPYDNKYPLLPRWPPTDEVAQSRSRTFSISEIDGFMRAVKTGFPGARDSKVTWKIHIESIGHWQDLLDGFSKDTMTAVRKLVNKNIKDEFTKWKETEIYGLIQETTRNYLHQAENNLVNILLERLATENTRLFTLNEDDVSAHERGVAQHLKTQSRRFEFSNQLKEYKRRCKDGIVPERVQKQLMDSIELKPPPHETVINEMATARGYYHCAVKRFTDSVAQTIIQHLFKQCRKGIGEKLKDAIGINRVDANEHCIKLLSPDLQVLHKRQEVEGKLESLERALRRIRELEREQQRELVDHDKTPRVKADLPVTPSNTIRSTGWSNLDTSGSGSQTFVATTPTRSAPPRDQHSPCPDVHQKRRNDIRGQTL